MARINNVDIEQYKKMITEYFSEIDYVIGKNVICDECNCSFTICANDIRPLEKTDGSRYISIDVTCPICGEVMGVETFFLYKANRNRLERYLKDLQLVELYFTNRKDYHNYSDDVKERFLVIRCSGIFDFLVEKLHLTNNEEYIQLKKDEKSAREIADKIAKALKEES